MHVQHTPDARAESEFLLVLTTCGSEDQARRLARGLVEARLAACVSLVPGVESCYRWNGAVEHDREVLLVIKTQNRSFDGVAREIRERSNYELPEILTVPVTGGSEAYLNWLRSSLEPVTTGNAS